MTLIYKNFICVATALMLMLSFASCSTGGNVDDTSSEGIFSSLTSATSSVVSKTESMISSVMSGTESDISSDMTSDVSSLDQNSIVE